jgi:hypothetical protein
MRSTLTDEANTKAFIRIPTKDVVHMGMGDVLRVHWGRAGFWYLGCERELGLVSSPRRFFLASGSIP